jgi:alpha-ketoglutarate-dependent taurine dioxygenase
MGGNHVTAAIVSATIEDPTVRAVRTAVLEEMSWYPSRPVMAENATAGQLLADPAATRERVGRSGLALWHLPEPLGVAEFIDLASVFGEPEAETESSLMDRVQRRVILDLKPDSMEELTEHNQPFTTAPLTFHIEGSRRPRGTSPTYLLFQCLEPPARDRGNQTVLRSIDNILAALTARTKAVLSETILTPESTDATVIYRTADRLRLNFRDPAPIPFRWVSAYDRDDVIGALTELLVCVYAKDAAIGIPWQRGLLTIVDNHRWLHARTRGQAGSRHLQRIRVRAERRP